MNRERDENFFTCLNIPPSWFLFTLFALKLSSGIVLFADIITDALTIKTYHSKGYMIAFYMAILFIVLPATLIAYLEFKFLRKAYGKSLSMKNILLRTLLNVPFQLTMIWYHMKLSYTYFIRWLNHVKGIEEAPSSDNVCVENERDINNFLMNVNDVDNYSVDNIDKPDLAASVLTLDNNHKANWWKELTREQWKTHLIKMNFLESMLESIPQLLLSVYVIASDHHNVSTIQYLSATVSFLSLCGGVVSYDKNRKDLEAERWMVDKTLLHSRVYYTRLEFLQLIFIALYKGCFFAARILSFVFFALFFQWFVMVPVLLHWTGVFCFYLYKWYSDVDKVTKQLRQADDKYRAYLFLSHDFVSVLYASLAGVFIHVRPYYHTFLDQPYCYMFWYYLAYGAENIFLILSPGLFLDMKFLDQVVNNRANYYAVMFTDVMLNLVGALFCGYYYFGVHKMRRYTSHAYPLASNILCCCCLYHHSPCVMIEGREDETWLPDDQSPWTVCKHADTSEMFHVKKDQVDQFINTYDTIARNDKRRKKNVDNRIECFIDDRCRFFYAPRSKLYKLNGVLDQPAYADTLPRPSRERLNKRSMVEDRDNKLSNSLRHNQHVGGDEELINPYAVFVKPKHDGDEVSDHQVVIEETPVAPPRRKRPSVSGGGGNNTTTTTAAVKPSEEAIYSQVCKRPPQLPPHPCHDSSLEGSSVAGAQHPLEGAVAKPVPVRPRRSIDDALRMNGDSFSSREGRHEGGGDSYYDDGDDHSQVENHPSYEERDDSYNRRDDTFADSADGHEEDDAQPRVYRNGTRDGDYRNSNNVIAVEVQPLRDGDRLYDGRGDGHYEEEELDDNWDQSWV